MNRIAVGALLQADIVVLILESNRLTEEDDIVIEHLRDTGSPVLLVLNKIDLLADKSALLPLIDTVIENGVLKIRPVKRNTNLSTRTLKIIVNARSIERLSVGGSGSITSDPLRGNKLTFNIAQYLERLADWPGAHQLYAGCHYPGARARDASMTLSAMTHAFR